MYHSLYANGILDGRLKALMSMLRSCTLCPRKCHVNRLSNEKGFCKIGRNAKVSSYCVHKGEEPPISGKHGSGTIFFSHCNLGCVYCQNYQISQLGEGGEMSSKELADIMISLQEQGCHNINFVSPTHVVPQIIEALPYAIEKGLSIPLVYNSNGYDSVPVLELLEGVIDIYMPDCKYSMNTVAQKFSACCDYWEKSKDALREMYRQVGFLQQDKNGVAISGLLIRHLVLPNNQSGTRAILEFIAHELSPVIFLSIMAQYHPCYNSSNYEIINRPITRVEYDCVLELVEEYGFDNAFCQELSSADIFLPDFRNGNPFKQSISEG